MCDKNWKPELYSKIRQWLANLEHFIIGQWTILLELTIMLQYAHTMGFKILSSVIRKVVTRNNFGALFWWFEVKYVNLTWRVGYSRLVLRCSLFCSLYVKGKSGMRAAYTRAYLTIYVYPSNQV